jgi:ribose 1,5-bisphosphate isomerase
MREQPKRSFEPGRSQIHPRVEAIIAAFEAKELHASRSGREVMDAFASLSAETSAATLEEFGPILIQNVDLLARTMNAYAPTLNVLHRVFGGYERARAQNQSMDEFQASMAEAAEEYSAWSQWARSRIAAIGKMIIPPGGVVYTFTLSETVLRTLLEVRKSGVQFSVVVTESRPNNDGRDTVKSLAEAGIPVDISIDAGMHKLIREADRMLVGAEAILADGSAICKVGTYPSALVARQYQVPVYVLVDTMKFYVNSLLGKDISLDPLQAAEVMGVASPGMPEVKGHLFDRTPAEYISGVVTELGILHPSQVAQRILSMPISESVAYQRFAI